MTEATNVRSAIEPTEAELGLSSTTRPSALVNGEAKAEAMRVKQMRVERANICRVVSCYWSASETDI